MIDIQIADIRTVDILVAVILTVLAMVKMVIDGMIPAAAILVATAPADPTLVVIMVVKMVTDGMFLAVVILTLVVVPIIAVNLDAAVAML